MTDCKIKRRKLIRFGTINMGTGKSTNKGEKWVEEECHTPIFSDIKDLNVCNSCLKGWTHKQNYMLETKENRKLIIDAKKLIKEIKAKSNG